MRILFTILLISLFSCNDLQKAALESNAEYFKAQAKETIKSGVYVRDARTGLCFLVTDAYSGASITCVPCDSLMFVRVREYSRADLINR